MKSVRGRLTVLSDNILVEREEGLGEHGFALLVETEVGNYLFDTGRGGTVVHNALVYKRDLGSIQQIILSHGHGDHTGGLPEVLRFHKKIDVLGHPDIFLYRFRKDKDGSERYSGIPYVRGYLERMGACFVLNDTAVDIAQGLSLTGPVPRKTDYEIGDLGNRFALRDGKVVPEDVRDDQSLIVTTREGILIVLGCAHAGIINIIDHAINLTGTDTIFGVVGGTHLGFSGEEQTEKTIRVLKTYKIKHLITGHCTGIEVAVRLRNEFPKIFHFSHVGLVFEF